ncbi:glycosyltransferase family 2 protein [Deferribacterales bacterium Es71-Z0220]|uniref:glycosyltransferase family 2 protein n=1 Tax=Deferrivibrio essentukiensis TaxID=2880922 RepID=UPI001F60D0E9|nr:glycosyltransferase family 2 protein [Deferrivibrio essentukiensis]MCB4205439.1 glycosyltransferase family 2 protein [Deferrivibrio essentukiensis]
MENEAKKEESLPLVSVCIPAYNHEKYIAECIQSVIDQDYKNIELIIINDGSKDNTHEVIMSFAEKCEKRFVRFEYRNRENRGLSATLNEAVDWSKGKYFTVIASDDVLIKNKVSLLVEKLEILDESYAVAFGNAIFIDNNSNEVYIDKKTGTYTTKENGYKNFLDYYTNERDFDYKDEKKFGSYETLIAGNYLPAMSYIIKLDIIRKVGAWTNGNTIEDWEMWLKLSKQYKFAYVDEPVAFYRWHDSNSCKLIGKNIHYDSIMLLKNDKEYAIKKNLKDIYYENLVSRVIGIRIYSKRDFVVELLKNINDINFMKLFFKKLIRKIIK